MDCPYEVLSSERDLTEEEQLENIVFRLVLVGDSEVGKTNLMTKLIDNKFNNNHIPTIGVDFSNFRIRIGKNSKILTLQIWDTVN